MLGPRLNLKDLIYPFYRGQKVLNFDTVIDPVTFMYYIAILLNCSNFSPVNKLVTQLHQ